LGREWGSKESEVGGAEVGLGGRMGRGEGVEGDGVGRGWGEGGMGGESMGKR